MMSFSSIFDPVVQFEDQDWYSLKRAALESGKLFVDPTFPPCNESLYSKGELAPYTNIVWKRPKEINESARLFVEKLSSHSVQQGKLGNCWFVAACSCITVYKENWTKVIPDYKHQEWYSMDDPNYAGIFKFRFYRFGDWIEVVIDDYLPTVDGDLIYCHSKFSHEFWSALLEKAYAKLKGSYKILEGGELSEILCDLTGGIAEPLDVVEYNSQPNDLSLFDRLVDNFENRALIAAAITGKESNVVEELSNGLLTSHAYSVTMIRYVSLDTSLMGQWKRTFAAGGRLQMIRLRNPWGQGEWRGAYSDGSPEWEAIDRKSRTRIGLVFDEDGEFWMPFDDFIQNFNALTICRQMNTTVFSLLKTWHSAEFHGNWEGHLTGGCLNFKEQFLNNPQYMFQMVEKDEAYFFLTQKTARDMVTTVSSTGLLHFGFTILKVETNRQYRVHRLDLAKVVQSSEFKNARSIFMRTTLKRGRYVLIPCTFEAGIEGQFHLRMFTPRSNLARELTADMPETNMCVCLGYPEVVTRITLYKAVGLERVKATGGADPFCVVMCEGQKSCSDCSKGTLDPVWGDSFVFYRKSPMKEPIVVEIYSQNKIFHDFLGRQVFTEVDRQEGKMIDVELLGRDTAKERNTKRPGRLFVEIFSLRDKEFLKI